MRIVTRSTAYAAFYQTLRKSMVKGGRTQPNAEDITAAAKERTRVEQLIPKKRKFK